MHDRFAPGVVDSHAEIVAAETDDADLEGTDAALFHEPIMRGKPPAESRGWADRMPARLSLEGD